MVESNLARELREFDLGADGRQYTKKEERRAEKEEEEAKTSHAQAPLQSPTEGLPTESPPVAQDQAAQQQQQAPPQAQAMNDEELVRWVHAEREKERKMEEKVQAFLEKLGHKPREAKHLTKTHLSSFLAAKGGKKTGLRAELIERVKRSDDFQAFLGEQGKDAGVAMESDAGCS